VGRFFYKLGRKVGPKVRKAKWLWYSVTGSEAEAIKLENDVGMDLAREVRSRLPVVRDERAEQLLDRLSGRLCQCVANRFRTFNFETINSAEPNAFALPGGFIFVTRSLLELCDWRADEVAFVLGHEMAHVIRGHAMERIVSSSAVSVLSRVAPSRGMLSAWLQKVGVEFLESAYSRDLECEADRLGVRLAVAAGFEPRAATELLLRLERQSQNQPEAGPGPYFASHPPYRLRVRQIEQYLRRCGIERK